MMPTSTLDSLLKSFWLNFEFNFDLQACSTAGEEKAGGFCFVFVFFFLVTHIRGVFKLPQPSNHRRYS